MEIELCCRSCELSLVVRDLPAADLVDRIGAFFAAHPQCRTTIDLSRAPGLRLQPGGGVSP